MDPREEGAGVGKAQVGRGCLKSAGLSSDRGCEGQMKRLGLMKNLITK
jgi:hypothetical protein